MRTPREYRRGGADVVCLLTGQRQTEPKKFDDGSATPRTMVASAAGAAASADAHLSPSLLLEEATSASTYVDHRPTLRGAIRAHLPLLLLLPLLLRTAAQRTNYTIEASADNRFLAVGAGLPEVKGLSCLENDNILIVYFSHVYPIPLSGLYRHR